MAKWEIGNVCGLRMVDGKGKITVSYDGRGLITLNASDALDKKTGDDAKRDELAQEVCDALNATGVIPSDAYMLEGR